MKAWWCGIVIAAACAKQADAPRTVRSSVVSTALPTHSAPDWRVYDGGDFTLRFPPNAVLVPSKTAPSEMPGTAIRGPQVHIPTPPERGPSDGPAYQLVIARFANIGHRSATAIIDSVRRQANNHAFDPDSLAFLEPPDTVQVGDGVAGLVLRPFCGDCAAEDVYIVGPESIVVLSYTFDIGFPGDRDSQKRLYQAVLSTFAWKK